jgi:putative phosphoribosyl transferase
LRFRDRTHAGQVLASMLSGLPGRECTVLAIPNGGVPVGIRIAASLGAELGVEIVRKVQIPGNTEAGFGAVTSQGDLILNRILVRALRLTDVQVRRAAAATAGEIRHRQEQFGPSDPKLEGRTVILTDDGLASGFTMLAAARSVKRRGPAKLIIAVPTAPADSIARVQRAVDRVVCPNVRSVLSVAVADAYESWYDLSTEEAAEMLRDFLGARNAGTRGPGPGN